MARFPQVATGDGEDPRRTHLRGRLIGLYLFAFIGLAPLGGLFAGWLADVGGTRLAFAVAGIAALATISFASARRMRAV